MIKRFLGLSAVGFFAILSIASFGWSDVASAVSPDAVQPLTQAQLEESLAPIYQLIGAVAAATMVILAWFLVIWPFLKRRIR